MFTTGLQIQEALVRTGRHLALADANQYSLLVCGGSALNLIGLVERPTRDVDVLALVKGTEGASVVAESLPEEVTRAAESVAADLNLPSDWLNADAMEVHRLGLPPGILGRAQKREFGPCLTVYLICRQDQVALKLYAAIDRKKGQRHFKDLAAINPVQQELEIAISWLLNRQTSGPGPDPATWEGWPTTENEPCGKLDHLKPLTPLHPMMPRIKGARRGCRRGEVKAAIGQVSCALAHLGIRKLESIYPRQIVPIRD